MVKRRRPRATGGRPWAASPAAPTVQAELTAEMATAETSNLTAVPDCVVRPELTEGPYFVDAQLNRSDIRSDPASGAVSDAYHWGSGAVSPGYDAVSGGRFGLAVHRAALQSEAARHTALTNLFTGRPARGILNRIMRELGPLNTAVPAFPLATSAIAPLRAKAEGQGCGDFSPLWSGQNTSGCKALPAAAVTRGPPAGAKVQHAGNLVRIRNGRIGAAQDFGDKRARDDRAGIAEETIALTLRPPHKIRRGRAGGDALLEQGKDARALRGRDLGVPERFEMFGRQVQRLQHHETRLVKGVIRAVPIGQNRLRKCRGAVTDQVAECEEGGGHGGLRFL